MGKLGKVVGWNLIALLAYTVISVAFGGGWSDGLIGAAVISFLHAIACFITAIVFFIMKDSERGKQWLLAAGIVLVIGISTCFGGFSGFRLH